jgi:hypothetical protein
VRAFNRVLSAFLAIVFIVVGVLTILEICRAALNQPPAVVQWPRLLPRLEDNSYDDAGPILVCIGIAVIGLLILVSGIRRGKPYALPAGSTAPGVRTEINRRSLQRAMRATVLATERVAAGNVTLRRKSASIVAHADTNAIDGLDADIRRRVEGLLSSIALVDPPRLKVKTYAASAPPTPAAVQTPVGVAAGTRPVAQPVGAQTATPATVAAPPVTEPMHPPTNQDSAHDTSWSREAPSASQTRPEPTPASEPASEPVSEPVSDAASARPAPPQPPPEPEPEATEPPTARLDDLLSSDPEDESR